MEIIIVLLLIIINGIFAMAEIAVVSARKSKLQRQANEGSKSAKAALDLAKSPNRFLSTVQIGITFIGIFAGAFGGETIAHALAAQLKQISLLAEYSDPLALFIVVALITYFSLIIGELVPKRLALSNPEHLAKITARPMNLLAKFASPLVSILTVSSDLVLRLLRIKPSEDPGVSEEEVKMLIREGARIGVFNIAEKDIVERTFKLSDKRISAFMTPRKEIVWLDIDSSFKNLRNKIAKHKHSHFPVCRDSLDKVLGVIRTEDLLTTFLIDEKIDLKKSLQKPIFVPETVNGLKILELFKKSGVHMAFIIDEYGSIIGLLTLTDILEEIVGDIPHSNELEDQDILPRDDSTFLIDGLVTIEEFKDYFQLKKLSGERSGTFHTIGGFIMNRLGRIPVSGDTFEWENYRFEVMDMDGNRVDKILLTPLISEE
jgi:putative hemolysin